MRKNSKQSILFILLVSLLLVLGACSSTENETQIPTRKQKIQTRKQKIQTRGTTTNENENTEADMEKKKWKEWTIQE